MQHRIPFYLLLPLCFAFLASGAMAEQPLRQLGESRQVNRAVLRVHVSERGAQGTKRAAVLESPLAKRVTS